MAIENKNKVAVIVSKLFTPSERLDREEKSIVTMVGIILVIMVVFIVSAAHAVTGTSVVFDLKNATVSGTAALAASTSSSTGKYVAFGTSSAVVTPAPTPTPTPTPTPAPIPTPTPPSGITYGWQITASNTGLSGVGVNRNSLPVFKGTITSGMTLSNVKITSSLDLGSISNVTLNRVWLAPADGIRAIILGPNTKIIDSDIDGSAMPTTGERMGLYAYADGNYEVTRVSITKMTIGAWLDGIGVGTGTVTDTYIGQMVSNNGAHMDGLTRRGGTKPLTITRSHIDDSGSSVTGALFLQNTWGDKISGITIKDTFLEGDGYVIGIDNKSSTSAGLDNVRVRSTGWGPISVSNSTTYTIWNNVRTYDGSRLPAADGAVINHP